MDGNVRADAGGDSALRTPPSVPACEHRTSNETRIQESAGGDSMQHGKSAPLRSDSHDEHDGIAWKNGTLSHGLLVSINLMFRLIVSIFFIQIGPIFVRIFS